MSVHSSLGKVLRRYIKQILDKIEVLLYNDDEMASELHEAIIQAAKTYFENIGYKVSEWTPIFLDGRRAIPDLLVRRPDGNWVPFECGDFNPYLIDLYLENLPGFYHSTFRGILRFFGHDGIHKIVELRKVPPKIVSAPKDDSRMEDKEKIKRGIPCYLCGTLHKRGIIWQDGKRMCPRCFIRYAKRRGYQWNKFKFRNYNAKSVIISGFQGR
jgi:hypothetical protein